MNPDSDTRRENRSIANEGRGGLRNGAKTLRGEEGGRNHGETTRTPRKANSGDRTARSEGNRSQTGGRPKSGKPGGGPRKGGPGSFRKKSKSAAGARKARRPARKMR